MKAINLVAPKDLRIMDIDDPVPGPGEVLVKVGLVGICGSDMHLYRHGDVGGIKAPWPWRAGHECMGTITACGDGIDDALLHQRVAIEPHRPCGTCAGCRKGLTNTCMNDDFLGVPPRPGALCEYLVLDAAQVEPISDRISDEEGVLLEPLAIALHAVNLIKPAKDENVLIVGTGVLGSCVLAILKQLRGMAPICVDLLPERLARAADRGAQATIRAVEGDAARTTKEILALTGGRGADRVFECAGVPDTFRVSADAAAPGAHVGIIGIPEGADMVLPAASTRRKGLTIRMVRRSLGTLKPCIDLMESGQLACRDLATHILPGTETAAAFDLVDHYRDHVLKALVDMRRL